MEFYYSLVYILPVTSGLVFFINLISSSLYTRQKTHFDALKMREYETNISRNTYILIAILNCVSHFIITILLPGFIHTPDYFPSLLVCYIITMIFSGLIECIWMCSYHSEIPLKYVSICTVSTISQGIILIVICNFINNWIPITDVSFTSIIAVWTMTKSIIIIMRSGTTLGAALNKQNKTCFIEFFNKYMGLEVISTLVCAIFSIVLYYNSQSTDKQNYDILTIIIVISLLTCIQNSLIYGLMGKKLLICCTDYSLEINNSGSAIDLRPQVNQHGSVNIIQPSTDTVTVII